MYEADDQARRRRALAVRPNDGSTAMYAVPADRTLDDVAAFDADISPDGQFVAITGGPHDDLHVYRVSDGSLVG